VEIKCFKHNVRRLGVSSPDERPNHQQEKRLICIALRLDVVSVRLFCSGKLEI
jgi:hypothetical protein